MTFVSYKWDHIYWFLKIKIKTCNYEKTMLWVCLKLESIVCKMVEKNDILKSIFFNTHEWIALGSFLKISEFIFSWFLCNFKSYCMNLWSFSLCKRDNILREVYWFLCLLKNIGPYFPFFFLKVTFSFLPIWILTPKQMITFVVPC